MTLRMVALVAVAGTMRAPITSIPPQIESVRAATGLSLGQFGLLTTIPLLCFAIAAPLPTTGLVRRFTPDRVVLAALLVLTAATTLRPLPSLLFAATLLIGSSIAVLNVTTPVIVRRDFPTRVPTIMAVYSAVLAIIATAGAGLAVPVSTATTGDWRGGATVWAGISAAVALLWVVGMRFHGTGAPAAPHPEWRRMLRNRTAWMVTVFMGTQSSAFYGGVTWLPQLLRDQGHSAAGAGALCFVCSRACSCFVCSRAYSTMTSRRCSGGTMRIHPATGPAANGSASICGHTLHCVTGRRRRGNERCG